MDLKEYGFALCGSVAVMELRTSGQAGSFLTR
jgi:hypothetical protein